jgi:hypothetical protein
VTEPVVERLGTLIDGDLDGGNLAMIHSWGRKSSLGDGFSSPRMDHERAGGCERMLVDYVRVYR